jgi:glycosyltransferase involved in cell wall biosynthesis
MDNPLVSIILPTYNRELYIKRAIDSVLNQTYRNIELIVIDDSSSDNTFQIISEIARKDSRVIILKNKENLGLVKNLNKGIELAKGKYVARLDDDDFWSDFKKIEKQVFFLEKNKDYGLVGGGMIKIDAKNNERARCLFPEKDKDIRKIILLYNPFVHTSVVFRKDVFNKVGGYDERFLYFEDWDLWMKIGKVSKFYNFQDYFVSYLDHEYDNPSHYRNLKIRRNISLGLELRRKYRKDYPGFKRAILLCFMSYFYSFLPFKKNFQPLAFKIKKLAK